MGWRDDATKVLKKALVGATQPKEIREISNALSSMQPYDDSPNPRSSQNPMPVRIVKPAKSKKKRWTFPKAKKAK